MTKNTNSTCDVFSLTIRTGNGINLGLDSVEGIVKSMELYLLSICKHIVLNIEKKDLEAHIQGALFLETPMRQDKLREKLLPYVMGIYNAQKGSMVSLKQDENVKKNALKVKPHNDFLVLVKYCMKDLYVCHPNILDEDPYTLLIYKFDFYKPKEIIDMIYRDKYSTYIR